MESDAPHQINPLARQLNEEIQRLLPTVLYTVLSFPSLRRSIASYTVMAKNPARWVYVFCLELVTVGATRLVLAEFRCDFWSRVC